MQRMEITFRTVRRQDISRIIEVFQSISDFTPPEEQHERIWAAFSGQSNVKAIVAECGGRIVAYGAIMLEVKIRGGILGHIEDIVTDKDHRKLGVGSKLMERLCEIAAENAAYKIVLECKEHNVPFYERLGFSLNGSAMEKLLK